MAKYFHVLSFMALSIIAAQGFAQVEKPIPLAEIPFEKVGSHLFIQLQVNGEDPCDFIFDTGAAITAFDEEFANELKLKPDYEQAAMGAAGAEVYQVCENQRLRFEELEIDSVTAILSDFSTMSGSMSRKIGGVVGSDFIRNHLVELNYTESTIRLYKKGVKGHDLSDYKAIKFDSLSTIPIIYADVELASGDQFQGKVLFDTAAGLSLLLNSPFVRKNNVLENSEQHYHAKMESLTTEVGYDVVKVNSVTIAGQSFGEMEVVLSSSKQGVTADREYMGILGNDVIERFDVFLDFKGRTLYLRPNAKANDAFKFNVCGLQLTRIDEVIAVRNVVENSPAFQAGFKVGDQLLTIDEMPVDDMEEVRQLLEKDGKTLDVLIRRGEAETSLKLTLKRILDQ